MRISDWSSDVCSSDLQFNAPTLCKLVCDGVKDDADQPIHLGNAKLWILGCQRLDKLGSDHATTPPVAGSTDTQQHYRLTLYTSGQRLRSPNILVACRAAHPVFRPGCQRPAERQESDLTGEKVLRHFFAKKI